MNKAEKNIKRTVFYKLFESKNDELLNTDHLDEVCLFMENPKIEVLSTIRYVAHEASVDIIVIYKVKE